MAMSSESLRAPPVPLLPRSSGGHLEGSGAEVPGSGREGEAVERRVQVSERALDGDGCGAVGAASHGEPGSAGEGDRAVGRRQRQLDGVAAGIVAQHDAVAVGVGEDQRRILVHRLRTRHAVHRRLVGRVWRDSDGHRGGVGAAVTVAQLVGECVRVGEVAGGLVERRVSERAVAVQHQGAVQRLVDHARRQRVAFRIAVRAGARCRRR